MLLYAYADGGFERIRSAPFPILVLMTRPPRDLPAILSVPLGIGALVLEHLVRRSVIHTESTRRLGFTAHVVDARRCRDPRELAELVAASSAIPPFIPTGQVDGKPMLDGGLLDNAPASAAEKIGGIRRTLVMLSQPYPESRVGEQGSRLYVAPTSTPPVGVFDCTRPDRLEQTIAMGEADAEHHGPRLRRFLLH